MKSAHLALVALLLNVACGAENPAPESAQNPVESTAPQSAPSDNVPEESPADLQAQGEAPAERGAPAASARLPDLLWSELLQEFRTDNGFRYAALAASVEARTNLDTYVAAIGSANVEGAPRAERLAFFLNAYNALTIRSVVTRWPIDSVMSVPGFFDALEHQVAGSAMTLNHLENEIIRGDEFDEARIHFAVNCASVSCPPLRATPFRAETLEADLEDQARQFIQASTSVRGRVATVSKLFEWFAPDFDPPGVKEFVALRLSDADASTLREDRTRLRHAEYDWAVNSVD